MAGGETPLIALEIDGILAEWPPEDNQPLVDVSGWWAERKPIWHTGPPETDWLALQNFQIHIFTHRPAWTESVTLSWLSLHYYWLLPKVTGIRAVGYDARKLPATKTDSWPDWAIEHNVADIKSYRELKVPVIAVMAQEPPPQLEEMNIPVCPDLGSALRTGFRMFGRR